MFASAFVESLAVSRRPAINGATRVINSPSNCPRRCLFGGATTGTGSPIEVATPMTSRITTNEDHGGMTLYTKGYVPMLSPKEISALLRANETSFSNINAARMEQLHGANSWGEHIIGFESNQLSANYPIEDRRMAAHFNIQSNHHGNPGVHNGSMFSVIDGHGGTECAQAVSERLYHYMAATLLPHDILESYIRAQTSFHQSNLKTLQGSLEGHHNHDLVSSYMFRNSYQRPQTQAARNNLQRFITETLSLSGLEEDDEIMIVSDAVTQSLAGKSGAQHLHQTTSRARAALRSAYVGLDSDISAEAKPRDGVFDGDAVDTAFSGACVCTAYTKASDLYVANTGDSRAVLGTRMGNSSWQATQLSNDQNTDNREELQRVLSNHPMSESKFVIKNDRLLGQLIPLRAFGDVRFKWTVQELRNIVNLLDPSYANSHSVIPKNYYTPPYLTAKPQVTHHRLTCNDRFLIIASDGVWDTLSSEEVVTSVGRHYEARLAAESRDRRPVDGGPDKPRTLAEVNAMLLLRRAEAARRVTDSNAATHIIRRALGGKDHVKVSTMLTLPPDVCRYYRDDMTITIIYFDVPE